MSYCSWIQKMCGEKTKHGILAPQSISVPLTNNGMLLCLQKPVAGHRQQTQHAIKANQRFIWLGNLHLITAVMS